MGRVQELRESRGERPSQELCGRKATLNGRHGHVLCYTVRCRPRNLARV